VLIVQLFDPVETSRTEISRAIQTLPSHSQDFWHLARMAGHIFVLHSRGSTVHNLQAKKSFNSVNNVYDLSECYQQSMSSFVSKTVVALGTIIPDDHHNFSRITLNVGQRE